MADSASDSYFQSDKLGLRHISSSLFNIPGFFVGFNSRSSSDIDSAWSPTSPLDFSFFTSLSNPFTRRPPKSPSQIANQKKWDCGNVGLGIINSLTEEIKPTGEVLDSTKKKKHIVFGPQVKTDNPVIFNSLPRNYVISLLSQIGSPSFQSSKVDEEVLSENRNKTMLSLPLTIHGSSTGKHLDIKPSSLPMPIGSSQGHIGSLTVRDIELSEDYTCIISHGPNPKTTHIFGDCILECHASELSNFDQPTNIGAELLQEVKRLDGSPLHPSNEFLSFCHSCKKKLEHSDDIHIYRGEKAFCSFDCQSETLFAEEEVEKTYDDFSGGSHESSYHEDLFLIS
uniref:FLZ-type domain-containing protein n=1 Tax=Rhizophora mucronata TaxID=61149 RepID=A0A2P2JF27_RHIMU